MVTHQAKVCAKIVLSLLGQRNGRDPLPHSVFYSDILDHIMWITTKDSCSPKRKLRGDSSGDLGGQLMSLVSKMVLSGNISWSVMDSMRHSPILLKHVSFCCFWRNLRARNVSISVYFWECSYGLMASVFKKIRPEISIISANNHFRFMEWPFMHLFLVWTFPWFDCLWSKRICFPL